MLVPFPTHSLPLSALALALLSCASIAPTPATAQLATVYSTCKTPNTVALTFDDGPYIYEQEIVNKLNAAGVKATFFVNGQNYGCIYDQPNVDSLKYAYAAGHEFGSHTWAHRDLATLSENEIQSELARVELALHRILGLTPALMRPPYGSYNDLVRGVSAVRNQSLILWDFDSGDSTGSTPAQSIAAYRALIAAHPLTVLALNHETHEGTVATILPFILTAFKSAGYTFTTVSECLGIDAYQSVGKPGVRTSAWTCN
ncbi:carbohydrate esterase family 4 protein [Ramaria rubella]|nr:carbohydrate esterase family 4 protein [Ramaria rubella]